MIDSVGFKVLIDWKEYEKMLKDTIVTQRTDKKTGEVEFEYNNAQINPSWNYKVSLKVTDEYWTYDPVSRQPYKAAGLPNITLEFSVPKVLFQHNLVSADPCLLFDAMHKVKDCIEVEFDVEFPSPNDWFCNRIDTCANYVLESESQVRRYINYLQRLNYPRRIKNMYEDTGLYFGSRHSTLKIYAKGHEFKKHDMDRFTDDEGRKLLLEAQRILRVEVELKKRIKYVIKQMEKKTGKIFTKFQGYPQMRDLIEIFDFKGEMMRVVAKLLCGTETQIMKMGNVLSLLMARFKEKQARSYHHIYMLLVTQGQIEAKKMIQRRTYYRALAAFRELGISLIAADEKEEGFFIDRGFPADFSLSMSAENKYYQVPLTEMAIVQEDEEPF